MRSGAIVIDCSSAFRLDPAVPLCVPEVNAEVLRQHQGIVAIPHSVTSQLSLVLAPLHLWSQETVQARFAYRRPGLYVLPVRLYRAAQAIEIPETAAYAGCRSWVELDAALSTAGAVPVLGDQAFHDLQLTLDRLLNPTALA